MPDTSTTNKKYVSLENLTQYDELIKAYIDGDISDLNELIGTIPNGEDNSPVADSVVEYVNLKTADIATSGELSDLSEKVDILIGTETDEDDNLLDAGKSVRTIANEELAKQLIPENAKEALDTLAEIAAWIQSHPEDVTAINTAIKALQDKTVLGTYVTNGETKEYDTVKTYVEAIIGAEAARADAAYAAKSLEGKVTLGTYVTNSETGETKEYGTVEDYVEAKITAVNDLIAEFVECEELDINNLFTTQNS